MKIKCTSHMDFLKVARDGANLVSVCSSFHNLLHDKKMHFGLNRGTCKFLSVERRLLSLPSEHLLKSSIKSLDRWQ